MSSFGNMPSTASFFSTYTAIAASAMLLRTMLNELGSMIKQFVPLKLREKMISVLEGFFGNYPSQVTVIIDEYSGVSINEIYQACELYLTTRITSSINQLKVSQTQKEKTISVTVNKGQKIFDQFEGIQLEWEFFCTETRRPPSVDSEVFPISIEPTERRSVRLSFHKKYREIILKSYLPYVVEKSKAIKEEKKVLKLYTLGLGFMMNGVDDDGGRWASINLDHPSTFDTLAMDPTAKRELIDDLDRFVKRKDFYRRVGKAWKRGYLLYGPPGTGKSSLIAAMANYLKFNIYDLELSKLKRNSDLRQLLVSTKNKSILVIEDIDCSADLEDRLAGGFHFDQNENQFTLSGLLNFVDGLWSSGGDEKIIVFTTNHKEKLDPALLRPGRMDMHIHMSYLTPSGFKILAFNYLGIKSHHMFPEVERLIEEVEVTPAEVAEELMKGDDEYVILKRLIEFLQRKKEEKAKRDEFEVEEGMGFNQGELTTDLNWIMERKLMKQKKKPEPNFIYHY